MARVSIKVTTASLVGAAILAVGGTAFATSPTPVAGVPTQITIPSLPTTTSTLVPTTQAPTTTTVAGSSSASTSTSTPAAASPSTTAPAKRAPARATGLGSTAGASFGGPGPNQTLLPPQLAAGANSDTGATEPDQRPVTASDHRTRSSRPGPPLVLCLMGALAALCLGAIEFRMLRPAQAPS